MKRAKKVNKPWSSLKIEMCLPLPISSRGQTILLCMLDANHGRTEVCETLSGLRSSSLMSQTPSKSKVLKDLAQRVMSAKSLHCYLFDTWL